MTDQQDGSIIKRESSSLSKEPPLDNTIASRMAGDLLSRVKGAQVAQERIQLGAYSFRPPDYRQIMRWAETFGIDSIDLLDNFEKAEYFEVSDGAILSLRWDLEKLPLPPNDWEDGMSIKCLYIRGKFSKEQRRGHLCITGESMPNLSDLTLWGLGTISVEISRLPKLEWLRCWSCNLQALRLEDFPSLCGLSLRRNKLRHFEFSFLPDLIHLNCSSNNHSVETKSEIST